MSVSDKKSQAAPRDGEDPRDRVMQAMRRATALSVLHSQAVSRRTGLSSTDLECLDLILMAGPATAGQIGRRTGLTSGAVTGLIDRLERQGYVRRRADPQDRRRVLVEIRRDRIAEIEALFRPMEEGFAALLAGYDDAFLDRMADLLARAETMAKDRIEALNREAPEPPG